MSAARSAQARLFDKRLAANVCDQAAIWRANSNRATDFCALLGVTTRELVKLFNGQKPFDCWQVFAIARALDISVDKLYPDVKS